MSFPTCFMAIVASSTDSTYPKYLLVDALNVVFHVHIDSLKALSVFDICTVFSDIFCRSHSKRAVTEFQLPVWRKMFIFLFENARQTIMLGGKKIFVIPSQTHLRNVVVNFRDDRRSSTRQFHGWKEIPSIKLTSVRCDTFRV